MNQFQNNNIPVWQAVQCATITPAQSIGLAEKIGSISAGKQADIVLFDLNLVTESHDIGHADTVDDLRRGKAVDLLSEDVVQALCVIREELLHAFAVV